MSRINFGDLTADDPEVDAVLQRLARWLEEHEDKKVVDPRERAWRDIPAELLARALSFLVENRRLRQVYMVETPSGILTGHPDTGRPFNTPTEVPTGIIDDRRGGTVDTAEATIVPVFRVPPDERS